MRVGIIGGLDRSELAYQRLAHELGHEVEHHTGYMRGTAGAGLERLIDRCDVIVIVTDVNSHGAVQQARKLLRTRSRPAVLVRRLGASRFLALLQDHGAPARLSA